MLTPLLKNVPELGQDDDDDEPTRGAGALVSRIHLDVEVSEEVDPTGTTLSFELTSGGRTDEGTRRPNNEDSMLNLPERALFVVADGMGGHAGGEVASQLAVEAIATSFM